MFCDILNMYKIVKKTKYGWTNIARKLKVFNRRFSTENEEKFNIAIDEKLKVDDEDPNEIYVNKKWPGCIKIVFDRNSLVYEIMSKIRGLHGRGTFL